MKNYEITFSTLDKSESASAIIPGRDPIDAVLNLFNSINSGHVHIDDHREPLKEVINEKDLAVVDMTKGGTKP